MLKPIVLVALIVAALYTLLRPEMGEVTSLRLSRKRHLASAFLGGGALGFSGVVLWSVVPFMALANLAGGYLGARTAIAAGSKFVRRAFLVLVAVLITRLAIDVL